MTRKSHKGIVGKENATNIRRYHVGAGIDFKQENLTNSRQIENEINKREK